MENSVLAMNVWLARRAYRLLDGLCHVQASEQIQTTTTQHLHYRSLPDRKQAISPPKNQRRISSGIEHWVARCIGLTGY